MKYLLLLLVFTVILGGCNPSRDKATNEVSLKGYMPEEIGRGDQEVWYAGALSMLGNSQNVMLSVGPEGKFAYTWEVEKPSYFYLGYNIIYLEPGDSLYTELDPYAVGTIYRGTHPEVNNYLKNAVRYNWGCYIGSLKLSPRYDREYIDRTIDSIAGARRKELRALKNASQYFREMEEAQITGDIVGTYLSMLFYSPVEEIRQNPDDYLRSNKERLCPLIREISQDKYLDLDIVRSVLFDCYENPVLKDCVKWTPRMEALWMASRLSSLMNQGISEESVAIVDEFLANCTERDICEELQQKRKEATRLMRGNPAPDLELYTREGEKVMLSSYKGKPLYIDLWASWCGPCKQQSPYFYQLAEKYQKKGIVFLSVSTDTKKTSWLKELEKKKHDVPEYNCIDAKGLSEGWMVEGIPRFILIDKDFNIFNAHAPVPSSGEEISAELDALLRM